MGATISNEDEDWGKVTAGTQPGQITIRAADSEFSTHYEEGILTLTSTE